MHVREALQLYTTQARKWCINISRASRALGASLFKCHLVVLVEEIQAVTSFGAVKDPEVMEMRHFAKRMVRSATTSPGWCLLMLPPKGKEKRNSQIR